jgi:hypothetical protein
LQASTILSPIAMLYLSQGFFSRIADPQMDDTSMCPAANPVEIRADEPKRHLLIAGTGRSGTSFLVDYLTALGLDTTIARTGRGQWHEAAQAGFENFPLVDPDVPYVVKTPWLTEFIDEVLANKNFGIDAVIIPVRDLAEAAASRIVNERRDIHERAPWMAKFEKSWDNWGNTPGGIVYSLNAVDQGRIIAAGFHHLVQRLVAADIPIVFLAFPKLVEDGDYLFEKLRNHLPKGVTRAGALQAHANVADARKVRVGKELSSDIAQTSETQSGDNEPAVPDDATLDHIAIRRELTRLRAEREKLQAELDQLRQRHNNTPTD